MTMNLHSGTTRRFRAALTALGLAVLAAAGCSGSSSDTSSTTPTASGNDTGNGAETSRDFAIKASPNILFFVIDDMGIDQMRAFGYGGVDAPRTPVIDVVAAAGVKFTNTWAMPECSPSRTMMFNGRYPIRTGVTNAILPADLANSQMSPYEVTTPKLLKTAGYQSGLFGKAHFSGSQVNPANNPYGDTPQSQLGWDQFVGWNEGAPQGVDTTAGGIAASGTYQCGYVPSREADATNGADTGACYTVDNKCSVISRSVLNPVPGRACMERGGILVPNATCQATRPAQVDFTQDNGYYATTLVRNEPDGTASSVPPDDPSGRGRGYRTMIEVKVAVDWIRSRPPGKPWMATVAFSSAHTPFQPPPTSMLPTISEPIRGTDCKSAPVARTLANQMLESADQAIGRVLVETGVATLNRDGSLNYDPSRSNTMVVILGDNGSYLSTVKSPFDPLHAKAYVNQTGVWVPLLVAGPMVNAPGRSIDALVNIADLYALFGEIAGVNVRDVVPASRAVDANPVLPYLSDPLQAPIRKVSFAHTSYNIRAPTTVQGACMIPSAQICTTLFPSQFVCESQDGVWYGAGTTQAGVPASGFTTCCQAIDFAVQAGNPPPSALPSLQQAVRNRQYKLLRIVGDVYDEGAQVCNTQVERYEFYRIDEATPVPRIDRPTGSLANNLGTVNLTADERLNYRQLLAELQAINGSVVPCPGDGNLDGVVDSKDLTEFNRWATTTGGKSSWYDFNLDGLTDAADLAIIQANLGKSCPKPR